MKRIQRKTLTEIKYMREAGLVVADIHRNVRAAAKPGVSLLELDAICADTIAADGAKSNFLGYYGYPASICTSVNDVVVHGIPDGYRLRAGDIVSFDCGAYVEREGQQWHGDAAFTMIVGGPEAASVEDAQLEEVTRTALWAALARLAGAKTVGAVGDAVEDTIDEMEPDLEIVPEIVEEFVGHGIGTKMHMEPDILNYRARGHQARIKPGMVFAVEPILVAGDPRVRTEADGWTVRTFDGSHAAHWEHTVAILPDGISVLTAPDAGAAGLADYGIQPIVLD